MSFDSVEPGDECPRCGHRVDVHPTLGGTDFSLCLACIYEEDIGSRDIDAVCPQRYPRRLAS